MTTWEEWLLKAKDAAGVVEKKTTELAETVKLKTKAAGVRKEIAATFEGVGRLLYDSRQNDSDVTELLDAAIQRVDQLQAELQTIEDEICAYKNATRCPECREVVDEQAVYCSRCGHKMKDD